MVEVRRAIELAGLRDLGAGAAPTPRAATRDPRLDLNLTSLLVLHQREQVGFFQNDHGRPSNAYPRVTFLYIPAYVPHPYTNITP